MVLEYEVDPDTTGCPDATEFRRNVQRQLGYDPFRPIADSRVAVEIARKGPGFEGRIRWSDENGRWVGDRKLTSLRPGCEEIAANLAFSVAVQIQLIADLAGPPEKSPPPPVVVPAPAPVRPPVLVKAPPPAPPMPAPKPRRRLALSMGVGPSLVVGIAPHPTGVGRIFVSGGVSRFSLELAVEAALPSKETEADGSGFSLDRFAADAAACGHAGAVAACATATTGLLRARGFGVDVPASPTGWFSDVGVRLAATRNLGQLFATIRADGSVAVSSWTVNLNGTAIWTTPRLAATAGLDLGVRFF